MLYFAKFKKMTLKFTDFVKKFCTFLSEKFRQIIQSLRLSRFYFKKPKSTTRLTYFLSCMTHVAS